MARQGTASDRAELARRLTGRLNTSSAKDGRSRLREVFVFRTAEDTWKARLRDFSEQCSDLLYDLLTYDTTKVAGVGWGATVASAVTGIVALGRRPREAPVWFVPTCGEPMGEERLDVSSSGLARILDDAINGRSDHHLSLAGIPAVIPYSIEDDRLVDEILNKLVRRGRQYRDIFIELRKSFDHGFDGPEPLVERLDAILTSLAPPTQPGRLYPEEQNLSGIERAELARLVQYDLGGVNVARSALSDVDQQKVFRWNDRWTGISLQHYTACAQRALVSRSPGVVVVAIGKNKAEAVLDAACRGLVNNLVIDEELALAIEGLGAFEVL